MKRKKISLLSFLSCLGLLVFFACQDDDDITPSGPAQVILSPDTLMINDNDTGSIFVSVQPAILHEWNVSAKPSWLEILPASGSVHNQILELQVVPDATGLHEGQYADNVEIITNGAGKALTHVILHVGAHPLADVQPNPVFIAAHEPHKDITLTNVGNGFLTWEIQSLPGWLGMSFSPNPLAANESTNIRLHANRTGLPTGTQTGQLLIVSNSEGGNIEVNISMEVAAAAVLRVSPENLVVGYFENHKEFLIINEGNQAFSWTFDANANPFLSASPSSGFLPADDTIEVLLQIDRTNLTSQTYEVDFSIHTDQTASQIVPTQINHYKEEKWLIEGHVIDAEYDRNEDVMIVVLENPDQIRKYNFVSQTVTTLDLNLPPTCVSVSTNGSHAAVGHAGSFTYVDLASMQIVDHYAVTTNALDIILAPNGWVYVFPKQDQWEHIRCINLSNGNESLHTGNSIYAGTLAKLHPSGNYIYGANNHLSPSDFEKYDITGGTAEYLWDSPYHGHYDFYGNIWISEDGNRLFAKSRNVFNSFATETNDMTYSGVLAGTGHVKTLDYSLNAGKIYSVFATISPDEIPDDEIRIYNTQFLAFLGTIPLPGFLIPDGTGGGSFYKSQGHFGFFNSAGTQYYVLVKVEAGSGAENEWAIATVEVE